MWYTQGELGRARTGLTRALALAHDAGDMDTVAHAEHLLGHVEHAAGQRRARPAIGSPAASKGSGRWRSRGALGTALNGMAAIALAAGDADQAERLLDEATSVLRHAGPWFLTWCCIVRAMLAVRRGNPDEAIALVRESLTLYPAAPRQVRVRLRAGSSRRRRGPQGRRRMGGADPGRPGRRHRAHGRDGRRQVGARPSASRRNGRCAHASGRIAGRGRMRQGERLHRFVNRRTSTCRCEMRCGSRLVSPSPGRPNRSVSRAQVDDRDRRGLVFPARPAPLVVDRRGVRTGGGPSPGVANEDQTVDAALGRVERPRRRQGHAETGVSGEGRARRRSWRGAARHA